MVFPQHLCQRYVPSVETLVSHLIKAIYFGTYLIGDFGLFSYAAVECGPCVQVILRWVTNDQCQHGAPGFWIGHSAPL